MQRSGAQVISFAVLLALVLGAFAMVQPTEAQATLVVSAGEAVVNQSEEIVFAATSDTAVSIGEAVTVQQGDTIHLSETASAQLRLKDGSTIDLEPGTILTVSELTANDNSFRARFSLLAGKTFSQVVRLLKPGDTFEIRTPSSTASVRGTKFSVEVQSPEATHFSVSEGVVQVTMGEQMIDVAAGFQVTAVVGQRLQLLPLAEPTSLPTSNAPLPTTPPTPIRGSDAASNVTETAVPLEKATEPEDNSNDEPTSLGADATDETTGPSGVPETSSTPAASGEPTATEKPNDGQTPAPTGAPVTSMTNTPAISSTSTPTSLPNSTPVTLATGTPTPPPTTVPTIPPSTSTSAPPPTSTPVPPTSTPAAEEMVTICHNGNTIEVAASAVEAHLAHGDTLGPCP